MPSTVIIRRIDPDVAAQELLDELPELQAYLVALEGTRRTTWKDILFLFDV